MKFYHVDLIACITAAVPLTLLILAILVGLGF